MSRRLILHADDLGLCHAANAATIRAMEEGVVNSASIMTPCPWFSEIAAYAGDHRDFDFGVHLTLTNEWDHLRWRPVAAEERVRSLVDKRGLLHDLSNVLDQPLVVDELETELRAQIDRAKRFGVRPTHVDSHDFVLMRRRESLAVYLRVARDYGLPALFHPEFVREQLGVDPTGLYEPDDVWVDRIVMAFPEDYEGVGLAAFYESRLRSLPEGLTVLLVHPAYDTPELRAVTGDHVDCGWAWRQQDADYFTGDACARLLEDEGIELVQWQELAASRGGTVNTVGSDDAATGSG